MANEPGLEKYWSFFPVLLQRFESFQFLAILHHVHSFCVFELEKIQKHFCYESFFQRKSFDFLSHFIFAFFLNFAPFFSFTCIYFVPFAFSLFSFFFHFSCHPSVIMFDYRASIRVILVVIDFMFK